MSLDKINSSQIFTEQDIVDWILPSAIKQFEPKYSSLARFAYGYSDSNVPKKAYAELASKVLEKAIFTFIFKYQYHLLNRDIEPYLLKCLNRLAENIKRDDECKKTISVPLCPACKYLNNREFLSYDGKRLRCTACTNAILGLEDRLESATGVEKEQIRSEICLRSAFVTHSRRGYKCPDCVRFIPYSLTSSSKVVCPYPSCSWFGIMSELEPMAHPIGVTSASHLSLNDKIFDSKSERQDLIKSNEATIEDHLSIQQAFKTEYDTIYSVIERQKKSLELEPAHRTFKKRIMYDAFLSVLKSSPEDMVPYIARQSHSREMPIQSRIFQEFLDLMVDELPVQVVYEGKMCDVYALQDPRLDLFTGYSEFDAYVKPDGTIPNLTQEVYIGNRKGNDRGPCFIGKLLDIISNDTHESLLPGVEYYTFSQIKTNLPPGLFVKVKHFRIPSHYEMNGLVYLQRIRRKIVDSVYQRLNGKKRVIES